MKCPEHFFKAIAAIFFLSFGTVTFPSFAQESDNCVKWGEDSIKTIQKVSLYREFFKQDNYKDALPHWRYVYKNAPGVRKQTYIDGVKMMKHQLENAGSKEAEKPYIDTIKMIYDQRIKCFGQKGYVLGRKALDMVRMEPSNVEEILSTFKESIDEEGNGTQYYVLYPYFFMATIAYNNDIINREQVMEIYNRVSEIISANTQKENKYAEKFIGQQNKIDDKLSESGLIETCDDAKDLYAGRYEENPEDAELWQKMYDLLKVTGCYEDTLFIEVTEKLNKVEPSASKAYFLGKAKAYFGEPKVAVEYFNQAVELEEDPGKKAKYYLDLGKTHAYQLNSFSKGREMALKAAELRENWGEPYLLIGDLYASSGELCGPGTGFKSQVVTWVAIDMYQKAKSIDPEVSEKAQKSISKYWKFMPNKEDIFMRGLEEGGSFTVDCWINRTTTIRVPEYQF